MQAVILAAGMGTRIREHHILPKGFIPIDDKPLIMHSVEALRQQGVTDILVVTGYSADDYVALSEQTQLFQVLHNPQYDTYGSLYSLYCARDFVRDDVLILESDILYETRALATVLNDPHHNLVLVSGFTGAGDEVYVSANAGVLSAMSKDKMAFDPASIVGEFVGISRLQHAAFDYLMSRLGQDHNLLREGHYEENGLVSLALECPIYCTCVEDLLWSEIDTAEHWARAKTLYQQMLQRTV